MAARAIRVIGLHKSYGDVAAVRGIDFSVEHGKIGEIDLVADPASLSQLDMAVLED